MKFPVLSLVICILTTPFLAFSSAVADESNADCQVRENGKDKDAKSGPCNVFKANGYVWFLLATGDWFTLKPKNKTDRFVDQDGTDVSRKFEAEIPVYHWPHRHITVKMKSD
jgi:hypothetical protein